MSHPATTKYRSRPPRLPASRAQRTWTTIKGASYGARPDARGPLGGGAGYAGIITRGDYTASTIAELRSALASARPGQVIFIPAHAVLDFTVLVYTEDLVIRIPAGVTLASDRGRAGSRGALLRSQAFQTRPLCESLGPGARVTGLRLRGPDPDPRQELHRTCYARGQDKKCAEKFDHDYYYKFPVSEGIRAKVPGLEVDNCEMSGWSLAAVYLMGGGRHHVHHNDLHHNQRDGLGYAVCLGDGRAQALIERNLFNYNRHSIAGTGAPGCAYEACHNVELGRSLSHCFDMHGGRDRHDGTDLAGAWLKIHHNTFRQRELPVCIRGWPRQEALVHHNWFWHHPGTGADGRPAPAHYPGRTRVFNNAYGAVRPQVLDRSAAK